MQKAEKEREGKGESAKAEVDMGPLGIRWGGGKDCWGRRCVRWKSKGDVWTRGLVDVSVRERMGEDVLMMGIHDDDDFIGRAFFFFFLLPFFRRVY